ncbi:DegT/DnrJ/EryC1/StrS family aminotransferase [Pseudonocardia benzenivorans]|uniref:DegT/DnrJ/EryC1/StrS aminotransferase n=2 Tax=Pseudonocardia TaxID=1847 RepID=F4CSP8_PSEUX|nr:DegT/DnrJ/EryC1/StrS family aminotransferase [Pseudonocardia dioxanivorans]AEA24120.1 DegT/DnrJ/EryC1/StrS aminotransferase [Pseudonocardia dioxanivorans CB1190]GJF07444.1 glutamine--scyllo-inositol aminotransferase [Pseudonocardia sp. D17]
MTDTPVPLVDLGAQHAQVADEVAEGWAAILSRTAFVGGAAVKDFETAYAEYIGAAHCIGVGNGTDAIEMALRALGVGAGDECVLPANTFIATAEAVARTGATVVLADCDETTALLDPAAAGAAVTPRTKAVLPVHLYGQAAPVEAIRAAVGDVPIVEDAAQSQGARRNGEAAGTLGVLAATSFYPGKNLGAYGDAGAVLTSDPELATAVRLLGEHGSPRKYEHTVVGFNSRMDALQAVVLSAKLRRLDEWNQQRRAAADRYAAMLAEVDGVVAPVTAEGNEHVWHLYVVRVAERDRVLADLHAGGIGAGIHYPTPVHLTGAFAHLGHGSGAFPAAEALAGEILSLPLYPGITQAQQERVVEVLAKAVAR